MSDSTQQPAEQSVVEPVQTAAPEPAAEPAVTFLRRHGAVITLAMLFLGYVLYERSVLRETIVAVATVAVPPITLLTVVLVRRR